MELGRFGIWTAALDALNVPAARQAVAELDAQGWGALWFGEACGREAFTAAQLYLGVSERLVVATGIASIYGRDARATAAASRTLGAVFSGRFLTGLGVSPAPVVERHRGHSYGMPLETMRMYLDALDTRVQLSAEHAVEVPRVLAALGPAMLTMARDRAAGAHTYLVTPGHTAQARAILGDGPVLAVEQSVVLDDDVDEWRRRSHEHLELYTGMANYRASWRRQGMTDDDAVRGGSDRLKAALVTRGLPAAVARAHEHLEAGASHVCLQDSASTTEPPRRRTGRGWPTPCSERSGGERRAHAELSSDRGVGGAQQLSDAVDHGRCPQDRQVSL